VLITRATNTHGKLPKSAKHINKSEQSSSSDNRRGSATRHATGNNDDGLKISTQIFKKNTKNVATSFVKTRVEKDKAERESKLESLRAPK